MSEQSKEEAALQRITKKIVKSEIREYKQVGKKVYFDRGGTKFRDLGYGKKRLTRADSYYIFRDEVTYPMKAIVRMAILATSGNDANPTSSYCARRLEKLGFDVLHEPSKRLPNRANSAERQKKDASYYKVLARPAQANFRKKVGEKFGWKCVITGCDVKEALEAAHIQPFCDGNDDTVSNGLLVRRDLHRLFDSYLLAICPEDLSIHLHDSIKPYFENLDALALDRNLIDGKSDFLKERWKSYQIRD